MRIEQATWGDLEASALDGTMRLEDGTVTLEPLTAALYDGRFEGKIVARPGRAPLSFQIEGSALDVSVERFLAGALGIEDRLQGRFSGTINTGGSAGAWPEVARSLEGRGKMRIENGEIESFPLLRSVANLSGVLGEDGLAKIASRLAESATRFSVLAGDFRLGGGAMRFDSIELRSADYTLRGAGSVDLVESALDGKAAMTFSPELSELMRAQDSRAAELFWSEASARSGAQSDKSRPRQPAALAPRRTVRAESAGRLGGCRDELRRATCRPRAGTPGRESPGPPARRRADAGARTSLRTPADTRSLLRHPATLPRSLHGEVE